MTNKEIRNLIYRYNKKRERLIQQGQEVFVPKISKAEYNIQLDADKQEMLVTMKTFLKRGSEKETEENVPLYVLEEVRRRTDRENLRRESIKKVREAGPFLTASDKDLLPLSIAKGKQNIISRLKFLRREQHAGYRLSQNEYYQDKYIDVIEKTMGVYAERIVNLIKKLKPEEFIKMYHFNRNILNLDFPYTEIEVYYKAQEILGNIVEFLNYVEGYNENETDSYELETLKLWERYIQR
nr:MAG TPA: hypothetical protein [Caudoviricetes sp.]